MQPYYDPRVPRKQITTFGWGDAIAILVLVGVVAGGGYLIYWDRKRRKEQSA